MTTVMLVEPSTTWLLVSTSPSGVRIWPVPASFPEEVIVLMSTIALASRLPLFGTVVGLAIAMGALGIVGVPRALARPQPTPTPRPPAAKAASRNATTIQRPTWGSERGGGGGGGTQ